MNLPPPRTASKLLPLVLSLLVAGALVVLRARGAWTGANWDTDDAMRLVQAMDLIAGQNWRDLTQYRLNPPAGLVMHWSRLADLPLAAAIGALRFFLPLREAAVLAAFVTPLVYLIAYCLIFARIGRLLFGRVEAPIAIIACALASLTISQFGPGRVDHHGLQVLCSVAALALLLQGLVVGRARSYFIWAAVPMAASLWIGNESLPFLAAIAAIVGGVWVWRGGEMARHGALLMATTAAGAGIALLVSRPLALLFSAACDAFSVFSVAAAAAIACVFTAAHALDRKLSRPWQRALAGASCAGVAVAALLILFPDCARGGYGAVDPLVAERWLKNVSEAQPLHRLFDSNPFTAIAFFFNPGIALFYVGFAAWTGSPRRRLVWLSIGAPLLIATALMFWQVRTVHYAHAFAVPAIAAIIGHIWRYLERAVRQPLLLVGRVMAVFLLTPILWAVAGTAVENHRKPSANQTAEAKSDAPCRSRQAMAGLAAMTPELVLGFIDLGPTILFNTAHGVIAAPYHRNNDGLRFAIEVFSETDEERAQQRLTERGVGLVVVCHGAPEIGFYSRPDKGGLSDRLLADRAPDWLVPVENAGTDNLRVFRLKPSVN